MFRKLAASFLVLALAGGILASGSNAIFTDQAPVAGNTFSTGTLDISTSPTSAVVTYSNMVPGDVVTAPLTVTNAGNVALRYSMTSTTTENTLAALLDLTVKVGVTTCTTAGFGASGTVLYGPADLGSSTGVNIIGDPTTGPQAADRYFSSSTDVVDADGTYPAGAGADAPTNEALCFQVSLPLATGNTAQTLTTTATFTFDAKQRRNNP